MLGNSDCSQSVSNSKKRKRIRQRLKKKLERNKQKYNSEAEGQSESKTTLTKNSNQRKAKKPQTTVHIGECERKIPENVSKVTSKQVEVVHFKSQRPKLSQEQQQQPTSTGSEMAFDATSTTSNSQKPKHIGSLNQLRHEVTLFGIKGFNKESKQELMEKLAVKLGAKPRKKEYVNYKDLINQRKQDKKDELERRQVDRALGLKVKKGGSTSNEGCRDINAVPLYGGTLGTYKHGVQIINKKHITKFHRKKHR